MVIVGTDRRYGLAFEADGNFTNWVEYALGWTYPTADGIIDWRGYGAVKAQLNQRGRLRRQSRHEPSRVP